MQSIIAKSSMKKKGSLKKIIRRKKSKRIGSGLRRNPTYINLKNSIKKKPPLKKPSLSKSNSFFSEIGDSSSSNSLDSISSSSGFSETGNTPMSSSKPTSSPISADSKEFINKFENMKVNGVNDKEEKKNEDGPLMFGGLKKTKKQIKK